MGGGGTHGGPPLLLDLKVDKGHSTGKQTQVTFKQSSSSIVHSPGGHYTSPRHCKCSKGRRAQYLSKCLVYVKKTGNLGKVFDI